MFKKKILQRPPFLLNPYRSRYLSSKQLGFLAQNYQALRHKHGVTPTFAADTGFDTRRASKAHASVARAIKQSSSSLGVSGASRGACFSVGESVLAKRRRPGGGQGWEGVELMDGWHPGEVVKVKKAGTGAALYNVR